MQAIPFLLRTSDILFAWQVRICVGLRITCPVRRPISTLSLSLLIASSSFVLFDMGCFISLFVLWSGVCGGDQKRNLEYMIISSLFCHTRTTPCRPLALSILPSLLVLVSPVILARWCACRGGNSLNCRQLLVAFRTFKCLSSSQLLMALLPTAKGIPAVCSAEFIWVLIFFVE